MSITSASPAPNPDRETRRWTLARDEYLAGARAEAVCRRYGLALSTFRRRARQEGWRRADQPPPDLPPPPEPPAQQAPAPDLTAAQMAAMAWRRVQEAVHAGRLIEARGWMRLYKDLNPYAEAEAFRARVAEQDRRDQERKQKTPEDRAGALSPCSPPPGDTPPAGDAQPPAAAAFRFEAPDLLALTAKLEAMARRTEQAVLDEAARLLNSPDDPDNPELADALGALQTGIDRLTGAGPPHAE